MHLSIVREGIRGSRWGKSPCGCMCACTDDARWYKSMSVFVKGQIQ